MKNNYPRWLLVVPVLMLVLFPGCGSGDADGGNEADAPQAPYHELVARFKANSFRIVFDYSDHSGAKRQMLTWTKAGPEERLDLVTERAALSGVSDITAPTGRLSCLWASDDERLRFDASCLPDNYFLRGPIDSLFEFEESAEFAGRLTVAGRRADCFRVDGPGVEIGTFCLSVEGEPLRVDVGEGPREIEFEAETVDGSPNLPEGWLQPIIPNANYEGDTAVRQVLHSELVLPDSPILEELKGSTSKSGLDRHPWLDALIEPSGPDRKFRSS